MKKFTIVLSDDEDDFKVATHRCSVFPSSSLARDILSAPPTELISTNSQVNNISQDISFVSTNQRCNNILDKINTEYVAPVRSPVPKSDEEIRFWVMTSRPPCLYDPEEDESFSRCAKKAENSKDFDMHQLSINRSTSHLNTGYNTNSLGLECSQNRRRSHSTSENQQVLENSSPVKEDYYLDKDIFGNNNSRKRMSSTFENADPTKKTTLAADNTFLPTLNGHHHLLENVQNKSNKISNTLLAECSNQKFFKESISTLQEPMNDYDSESSVLTINYIQYVNDKAKINRKCKRFIMAKRRSDIASSPRIQSSPFKFKSKNAISKTTFFKNNKADVYRNTSSNLNLVQLNQSSGNIENYESENIKKKNKTLIKKKHFFKQSSEEMKRKNELVLDTSKTSSSSIENSFSDKQRLFKKSFFKASVDTDDIVCKPLSMIENKAGFSDCRSSSVSSSPAAESQQNVSVVYTKVETHYISSSIHNTDSTYSSMIKFKQTTSFLSEGQ